MILRIRQSKFVFYSITTTTITYFSDDQNGWVKGEGLEKGSREKSENEGYETQ